MAVVVVGKVPSILVGSEGGMVLRLFGHGLAKDLLSKKKPKNGTLRWEPAAMELAAYVPSQQQAKLVKHVEAYVTQDHRDVVHARDVFKSKPKPTYVFPPPAGVVTEFEKHTGPTTALALSPFDRRLFLSAGVDGKLKLFSTLRTKPLAELERGGAADAGDAGGRFKAQGNGLYSADWCRAASGKPVTGTTRRERQPRDQPEAKPEMRNPRRKTRDAEPSPCPCDAKGAVTRH
jgi:hypothetical protein